MPKHAKEIYVYTCVVVDGKFVDGSTVEYIYKTERAAKERFAKLIGERLMNDGNFVVGRYENSAGHWANIRTAENFKANKDDGWVVSMFEAKPLFGIKV